MIARRDLLVGAGCVVALGAAEALRPRRTLRLLRPGRALAALVPAAFAGWHLGEGGELVLPDVPGSLFARLYADRVARTYARGGSADVMLAVAYGAAQSDLLQLHRPERAATPRSASPSRTGGWSTCRSRPAYRCRR
ncbi:exosortase-associated EpsI family protein [Sphingomonas sp. MMS24-JH45]